MTTYSMFILMGKDAEGKFTVPVHDPYDERGVLRNLTADDVKRVNALSTIHSEYDYKHGRRYFSSTEYQFVRFKDPMWRSREKERMRDSYTPLPWTLDPIEDHFAHVAVDDEAMVSFTPNPDKGMVDIKTTMKPGRYLAKFYPHLDKDDIRAKACEIDKANEIKFATTPDDIEKVYTNGPSSCMSYKASQFKGEHPSRVYGAGDLAIAYLAAVDLDHPLFKASARVLVWPAKKTYGRMYGDEHRLKAVLEKEGYTQEGYFEGAKLLRIPYGSTGRSFIGPFLDGIDDCSDNGEFLIIDRNGGLPACNTCGLIGRDEEDEFYCSRMEDYYSYDDWTVLTVNVRNGNTEEWCEVALDRGYAFYSDISHEYYDNRVYTQKVVDGDSMTQEEYDETYFTCPKTGKPTHVDDCIHIEDLNIDVRESWANDNAWFNPKDSLWYSEESAKTQEAA